MGKDSKIEWCHHTCNLVHGCTHAQSIGCDNCYAETISKRWGRDIWGNDKPRLEIQSVWKNFATFQKLAKEANEMHRVFVGSMMDIFEKPMPVINSKGVLQKYDTDYIRQEYFYNIVPNTPNLMHLLLTKRPSNINKYIPEEWKTNPPENVMFGTSPVNQETADRLIPQLLQVNGKRFLSVEPQLAEINLEKYLWVPRGKLISDPLSGEAVIQTYCEECGSGGKYLKEPCDNMCAFKPISWVINGGESGGHKRPFNPDWARVIREQCKAAGVPFFFKQMDKVQPIPKDLEIRQFPEMKLIA